MPQVIQSESRIKYNYATIKVTKSRIDKGLIAIPLTLAKWFPDHNDTIQVYLNDSPDGQAKHYSSYSSKTRECRIGSMKQWFQQNNIKSGDEIVIQFIDKERFIYRIIPEKNFILKTKELQYSLDNAETEKEALGNITTLAEWTHLNTEKVALNEFKRLIDKTPLQDREYSKKRLSRAREKTPPSIRILLGALYRGHCQVCDFWFLKKDNTPHYEIHHINPFRGDHPKNLVLVCPNCHSQFEYADVNHSFNDDSWLIRVSFNKKMYPINQIILKTGLEDSFKRLFI